MPMTVLLIAFSLFNLFAAAGALGHAVRLLSKEEQDAWRSKTLLFLAALLSWTFPLAAFACTGLAWNHYFASAHDTIPIILAPLAWLLLLGIVFVAVDYADDGVIGNARRRDGEA
jgi:hypothetical protein